ncbi:MAG: hypothetical protein WC325_03140 [Candidatus Bathyarchaeia archaeon]|jgi:multisubunit Na+/H+ antiporter MnhB subunit
MRKTTITISALLLLVCALSFLNNVWGNGYDYETVGGEISQTNFITVFLVPTIIAITILGSILLFAYIRIKTKPTQ